MLPLRLAVRYIFSRKSSSIVNLIAIVSVISLSLTVAASLFSLSLQTGLENFVLELYENIDPQFRIVRADGRMFDRNILSDYDNLCADVSIRKEVNVLLECGNRQTAAVLVGVDTLFTKVTSIDDIISSGRNPIPENSYGILLGRGLAYELGISSGIIKPVTVSSIKRNKSFFSCIPLMKSTQLLPVGVYSLDQDTDSKYAFTPLDRVDFISSDTVLASSLDIKPLDGFDKRSLEEFLGQSYVIKDSSQIRDYLHKMINNEKWVIFALLILIALLASLSLSGTIVVMKKEKEEDLHILKFIGFEENSVLKTFFLIGFSLTLLATLVGVILALLLVFIQDSVGLLTLAGETFLMNSYPVVISPLLWLEVIISVILVGALVSFIASIGIFRMNK